MIATKINWADEWFSSKNSEEIFLNDNNLNWIKIKRIIDINIDNIPEIIDKTINHVINGDEKLILIILKYVDNRGNTVS
jgi:hypothetical protein